MTYNKHRIQLLKCGKIDADVCTSFWGHYLFKDDCYIILQQCVTYIKYYHFVCSSNINTSKILPLALFCLAGTNSTIYLVGDSNQFISLRHLFFLSSHSGSNFHNSPKTVTAYFHYIFRLA